MDDEPARSIVDRAREAVGEFCYTSVTPRHQRLTQGDWVMPGSVWTADSSKAWQVWYHPETDDGCLWPYIVTKDGVIPQRFEP